MDSVVHDLLHLLTVHWLEIADEASGSGHVILGDFVESTVDCLIRTLEESELDILDELVSVTGTLEPVVEALDTMRRNNNGSADVILGLELVTREEVLPQGEHLPGQVSTAEFVSLNTARLQGHLLVVLRSESKANKGRQELVFVHFQLVSQLTVDGVGLEVRLPVVPELGLVVLLHYGQKLTLVGADALDEGVVLGGVVIVRGEQLDDDAGRDAGVQKSLDLRKLDSSLLDRVLHGLVSHDIAVVLCEDLLKDLEVLLLIVAEDRSKLDHVLQPLADLRLSAAGDGSWLVQVGTLRNGSLEAPPLILSTLGVGFAISQVCRSLLDHLNLVAARKHVGDSGLEANSLVLELDGLVWDAKLGILREVEDVRVLLVHGIALLLVLNRVTEQLNHLLVCPWGLGLGEVLMGATEVLSNLAGLLAQG
mmetsp:Transcript_46858/g.73339  ORF Transcript_46858/g.73339 Transcript_46858/m.73339 type:complete len:423 (-) Transcript_46858:1475-2743(-)